mgnify:CR=1 FL=1
MITSIIILSSILLIRTFLFYYNYLFSLLNLLPMEIIALSTSNLNCNIDNCEKETYQVILDWVFLGWVDNPNIKDQENVYSSWIPLISLLISLFIFNLSRLLYFRKKMTRVIFFSGIIRFFIIHFSWIVIWTINNLLFLPKGNFWILFLNLIVFCFVSSGLMAFIFYMIYGKHFVYFRYNYYWLIQFYSKKYKFYILVDLIKRLIASFFIFFYHYHLSGGMFYLLSIQILFIVSLFFTNVFNRKKNKMLLILNLVFSLIPTTLSIFKFYYKDYSHIFDLINFILMIIYISYNILINLCHKESKIIEPPTIEITNTN